MHRFVTASSVREFSDHFSFPQHSNARPYCRCMREHSTISYGSGSGPRNEGSYEASVLDIDPEAFSNRTPGLNNCAYNLFCTTNLLHDVFVLRLG